MHGVLKENFAARRLVGMSGSLPDKEGDRGESLPVDKSNPIRRKLHKALGWALAGIAVGLLRAMRLIDRSRMADCLGLIMRKMGPWLSHHRIGRANLKMAFPTKSDREIEHILSEVWDNLGRVAAEFAQMDRLRIGRLEDIDLVDVIYDSEVAALHKSSKPNLYFGAHFANWEISALVPPAVGIASHVLYRPSNYRAMDRAIVRMRAGCMGTLVPDTFGATFRLSSALEQGQHIGLLVDQRYGRGVDVTFFGRRCKANPLLAQLARRFECKIHGMRFMRQPHNRNRFWGEITQAIEPPRDACGRIDIQGTMQVITSVVEEWVRQDPGQWLWIHNRWR
jgi:KDO2-lipid IV(A) lauroyltransferase